MSEVLADLSSTLQRILREEGLIYTVDGEDIRLGSLSSPTPH